MISADSQGRRGRRPAPTGLEVKKEIIDGQVRLSCGKCEFRFQRPRPGVLQAIIMGADSGQFGTAALDEIRAEIGRQRPVELFVDARKASGPTVEVSEEWTGFFTRHRSDLSRVHVLVGSKALNLTIEIARHLSRTGSLIQIYSDPDIFEARLSQSPRPLP
jgi:hypothetical protein